MMKRIAFSLMVVLVFACNSEKGQKNESRTKDSYTLLGNLEGFADSSMVIMSAGNKPMDSALIIDDKFKFTGSIKQPMSVYLNVKGTRDFTTLWLEPSEITISAKRGEFRQAKITGSELQKEDDLLRAQISPLRFKQDSLEQLLKPSMEPLEQQNLIKSYLKFEKQEDSVYKAFIADYKASLVSADILNIYKTTWGKAITQTLYDGFTKEVKNSTYGKAISEYLALNKALKIGDPYVDFTMADIHGVTQQLSDSEGKVVLLEFWASWCGPCRAENPNLVNTYKTYQPKGFEIFAVSLDIDKEDWLAAIEKDNLPWLHVSDLKEENKAGLIYGVNGIPDNFLIDENGIVIARNLRGEQLNEALAKLL